MDGQIPGGRGTATLDWHQLLQVIHGVLLSASVGAFAASAVPPLILGEPPGNDYRLLWLVLATATIIVAFDAWYQFSVNGRYLHITGEYTAGVVTLLIVAMVWTSFLPFQFLVRTLDGASWHYLQVQPGNRLFWICLLVTLAVETTFIGLVALRAHRESGTATAEQRPPVAETVTLGRKPLVVLVFRIVSFFVLLATGYFVLGSGPDQVIKLVIIMVIWAAFRAAETLVALYMDRHPQKPRPNV